MPTAKQTAGPLWAPPKKPVPFQTEFRQAGLQLAQRTDPKRSPHAPPHRELVAKTFGVRLFLCMLVATFSYSYAYSCAK